MEDATVVNGWFNSASDTGSNVRSKVHMVGASWTSSVWCCDERGWK